MTIRLLLAAALLLVATTGALTHAHLDTGVDSECVACSLSGQPVPSAPINFEPPAAFAPSNTIPSPAEARFPQTGYEPHAARAPPVTP